MSYTPLSAYATTLDEARGVIDRLERECDTLKAELTSARAAIKDFLAWYRDITNHGVYIDHDRERMWLAEAGK